MGGNPVKTWIDIVLILVLAAVLSAVFISRCTETPSTGSGGLSAGNSTIVSSNGTPGTETAKPLIGNKIPATETETQTPENETSSEVGLTAAKKSVEDLQEMILIR